jgi:hypothetical protein
MQWEGVMATKEKTVQVVLDLPPQLANAIERHAKKAGRRFKQLCIDAIRYRVRMLAEKHNRPAEPALPETTHPPVDAAAGKAEVGRSAG